MTMKRYKLPSGKILELEDEAEADDRVTYHPREIPPINLEFVDRVPFSSFSQYAKDDILVLLSGINRGAKIPKTAKINVYSVDPRGLIPYGASVIPERVVDYLNEGINSSPGDPVIIDTRQEQPLIEGNHRVVVAIEEGREVFVVNIAELSSFQKRGR